MNTRLPDILDSLPAEDQQSVDRLLTAIATVTGAPLLFGGAGPSTTHCAVC